MSEEGLLSCKGAVSGTTILHSSGDPTTLEKFFASIQAYLN
jgi:hypothetical protein